MRMTSSLAAERQSGHSRPSKKNALFIGIEDPTIAAEYVANANGHPLALESMTLAKGAVIEFQRSSNAEARSHLRTEVRIALSNHYSLETVNKVMGCATNVQPSYLARILRNGKI